MRIAIFQGAFFPVPPILGGAVEKRWFALAKEFARRGHEVVHISRSMKEYPDSEVIDGVQHLRIKGYDTPKSGIVLKVLDLLYTLRGRKLFSTNYDVVVSNTFWAPLVLPKQSQKVCMVDVARMPKGQLKFYRHVARLRANSSPVAMASRNELPEGLHNKVVMIPNPLPFTPSREVDLTQKKPIILYTGRVHPEKGLDLLVEAYSKTNQAFKLQIVGSWKVAAGGGGEEYLDSLRQKAKGCEIEFVGPVYNTEALNKYYEDASIFVYPSVAEQGETFGLAPLEAIAWGCAPIVSDLSCFKDFIKENQNGLVFDHRSENAVDQLAAHITNLQENRSLRETLATSAIGVRESHSTKHIADQFLREFEQMLKTND